MLRNTRSKLMNIILFHLHGYDYIQLFKFLKKYVQC